MRIIENIIEQHAEEAAFNWLLRDSAVSEPHYDLSDLAHLDDRIEANIDGLRVAGDASWEICREAMAIDEPGEIFTAGVLAFESQVPKRMNTVLAAVAEDVENQRALCSAMGWIAFRHIARPAIKLLHAKMALLKRIALSVYAIHRQDIGPTLGNLIFDVDPGVRSRALKAAGELGRMDLLPMVLDGINDKDDGCCFYAAWSAALLGKKAGADRLKRIAQAQSPFAQRACDLAVRIMEHGQAVQWLNTFGRNASSLRLAIKGYGALGDPQPVAWLIEMMGVPELARIAGEAFSMITGVDIAYEDLDTDVPENLEGGPTEDPEDEDVAMDPDEDLPWPDSNLIAARWHSRQNDFQNGRRYLAGRLISMEHCRHVLLNGYQRQRMAAATELALLKPGGPLFEVRAPGFLQQRLLGLN